MKKLSFLISFLFLFNSAFAAEVDKNCGRGVLIPTNSDFLNAIDESSRPHSLDLKWESVIAYRGPSVKFLSEAAIPETEVKALIAEKSLVLRENEFEINKVKMRLGIVHYRTLRSSGVPFAELSIDHMLSIGLVISENVRLPVVDFSLSPYVENDPSSRVNFKVWTGEKGILIQYAIPGNSDIPPINGFKYIEIEVLDLRGTLLY